MRINVKIKNKDMNLKQKKALYEQIMKSVAKQVKKALNENIEDSDYQVKYRWAQEVDLFSKLWDAISYMSWEDWTSMGSIDKEEYLSDALLEIPDCPYTEEDLYDIFWDWVHNLDESEFEDEDEYPDFDGDEY